MQPHATPAAASRESGEQARTRALVRFNGLAFHGIVCASLLESAAPAQAARLAQRFAHYPDVRLWLEERWWPRRGKRGD